MIPDYPLMFWIYAIIAITLLGISKAGFGAGASLLAIPLLSMVIPVIDAAALLLPLLIVCDIFSVLHYRKRCDQRNLRILLPGAIAGIAVGAFCFSFFQGNQQILKTGIGILAVTFVVHQWLRNKGYGVKKNHMPTAREGVFWGCISGFTSTLAHAGGPPVMVYLLPQRLPRDLFVGTTVIFFATMNAIKLIPYHYLGLLKVGNLVTVLILSPLIYLGVLLGIYLNKRFNDLWFNRVIYTLLFLTGTQLIIGKSLLRLVYP
ncbi:MAG: sulfite exporter TauE/SafE family protein [Desulforhopalus sp.]